MTVLDADARNFLESQPVAVFATVGSGEMPHAVPVCFIVEAETAYITIDEKPKRVAGRDLQRLKNIANNESVALVAHHYDHADWQQLGWVMLQGVAEILWQGVEHDTAQVLLRNRYEQLRRMAIENQPVIAIRIRKAVSWGKLDNSRAE